MSVNDSIFVILNLSLNEWWFMPPDPFPALGPDGEEPDGSWTWPAARGG